MKRTALFLLTIFISFSGNLFSQQAENIHSVHGNDKMQKGFFYRESGNLKYTLTNNEIVAIKLTDANEKYIKAYLNYELKKKGEHEQNIQLPSDLPSGLYFLTISTINGEKLRIKIKM